MRGTRRLRPSESPRKYQVKRDVRKLVWLKPEIVGTLNRMRGREVNGGPVYKGVSGVRGGHRGAAVPRAVTGWEAL